MTNQNKLIDQRYVKSTEAILPKDAKLLSVQPVGAPKLTNQACVWLKVSYMYNGKKVMTKIPSQAGTQIELEEK